MKIHTSEFKNQIKLHGRELDSVITYTLNNETITLGNEQIISVSPHYEGAILKSVMKQLDIVCDNNIPINTELNYRFGVKTRNNEVIDYRDNYDYVNFGSYIVYSSEKQEDTGKYKIICYDKMLYTMKDYEKLNITYPISIRDYINAICNYLGLTFKNANDTFANYNRQIQSELYLTYNSEDQVWESLDYTFRDVLDEIAQATASTICINEDDDELEIRYVNDTQDLINEEYLKDVNVDFGEQYGPINTIVLSRNSGNDKVYMTYPPDLPISERNAIEICDNQIMNWNDRSDYLSDILNRLNGLTYYLNDYTSTGITYYSVCDKYSVQIGETVYPCVMFNDDIKITQGLVENIHTERPEESDVDYTKADKTDRRINQTYSIVDKQNQKISDVITTVTEQNDKISEVTQTVDEINAKLTNITDLTVSDESNYATVELDGINASEPVMLRIHPTSENLSFLYPYSNTYPSSTTYLKTIIIRFYNERTQENIDYQLPGELLRYNSEIYDEFYLDYDSQTCQITKRCQYNNDGTVGVLPLEQVIPITPYPEIELTDGDYTISILGYNNGYIFVRLMASNIYTTQFYTKAETNSLISQTAQSIELDVSQTLYNYPTNAEMNASINLKANEINQTVSTKVGNNEVISRINQTPEQITINASKVNIDGVITAINDNNTTTIDGDKITTGTITANQVASDVITTNNFSAQTVNANKINGGTLTASSINLGNNKFKVTTGGALTSTSGVIGGWTIADSSLSVVYLNHTISLTEKGIEIHGPLIDGTIEWFVLWNKINS